MEDTPIAKNLRNIDLRRAKANFDNECKNILADKMVLAHILKECIEDFADCTYSEIAEKYIEGTPEVDTVSVHRSEGGSAKIFGMNTEDASPDEGTIRYDVLFKAISPKSKEKAAMYVNIEGQNNSNPGYSVVRRGIYYCSRLLSFQYNREFANSKYNDIKKVYSIWICFTPSKGTRSTITKYSVHKQDIYGHSEELPENYDLINVVILGLDKEENSSNLLNMLRVLFSNDISLTEKKDLLHNKYKLPMTRNLEERVSTMCDYSEQIEYEAMEKGMQQGMQQGIQESKVNSIIKMLKKGKLSFNEIAEYTDATLEEVMSLSRQLQNK